MKNIGPKILKSVLPNLRKSVLLASNIYVNQALNVESRIRFFISTFFYTIYVLVSQMKVLQNLVSMLHSIDNNYLGDFLKRKLSKKH